MKTFKWPEMPNANKSEAPTSPPVLGNLSTPPVSTTGGTWQPTFNLPRLKYGDYAINLKNIGQGLQQAESTTGQALSDQARSGLYKAGMDIGAQQAAADVKTREERLLRGQQNEIQTRMVQLQEQQLEKMDDQQSGGRGCCFIFIEAYNGLLPIVRRYRDEHMTVQNRRGYYRIADRIVPIMKRDKGFKWAVRILMTGPMVSYGKYFYGEGKVGVIFKPIAKFWLKVFDLLGRKPYVRKNGEEVV